MYTFTNMLDVRIHELVHILVTSNYILILMFKETEQSNYFQDKWKN